jgi:very-short-patch-repair endonuclease
MAPRPFVPYRSDLKSKSRTLRRDPTPAERKLWFEFLRDHPVKFTRQKPLGRYIADFYCAKEQFVIELDGDSHYTEDGARHDRLRTASLQRKGIRMLRFTNAEVMEQFEGVCGRIEEMLGA